MIYVFISLNFDAFPRVFKHSQSGLATRKLMGDTLHKEEKAQKVTARHCHGKMDRKEKVHEQQRTSTLRGLRNEPFYTI